MELLVLVFQENMFQTFYPTNDNSATLISSTKIVQNYVITSSNYISPQFAGFLNPTLLNQKITPVTGSWC